MVRIILHIQDVRDKTIQDTVTNITREHRRTTECLIHMIPLDFKSIATFDSGDSLMGDHLGAVIIRLSVLLTLKVKSHRNCHLEYFG